MCEKGSMGLFDTTMVWLRSQVGPGRRFKNKMRMVEALGLDEKTRVPLYSALKDKTPSTPAADTLLGWLDALGAQIIFPGEYRQAPPLMLPAGKEPARVAKLLEQANAVLVAAEGHADDAAALRLAMSMLGKQLEGLEHGEAPPELRRENG